jgi:5-dehydro-2-deoxygluconokinase
MTITPFDFVAVGRAGIDLYSLDYDVPLQEVRRFAKYVGGTSANVVVGASRLGLKCALITRVGDDELGDYIINFLSKEGVETKYVKRDKRGRTGIVFAEISPGRDSKFIFYRENAADLRVSKADIAKDLLVQSRALIVTGTGLSQEPSYSANLHAARLARHLRKNVVFNLDWRPSLWYTATSERVSRYQKIFNQSDIVMGNEIEYLAATGTKNLSAAVKSIQRSDAKVLVVTHSDRGATILAEGSAEDVEGFRVPLLKGLGGGDGFIAGFMFGYLKGWAPAKAAMFGNAVGAIVVMGHACSESMPRLRKVTRFLKSRGFDIGTWTTSSK